MLMNNKWLRKNILWMCWQYRIFTLTYLMTPYEWSMFHSVLIFGAYIFGPIEWWIRKILFLLLVVVWTHYACTVLSKRIHLLLENLIHLLGFRKGGAVSALK